MLALLKKDLFILRKTCLVYIVMLLFYIVFGAVSGNFAMFQSFVVLVTMMLPVTSMSCDERSHWDKYGLSLPLSRHSVVFAKYLFTGLAMVAGMGFSAVVMVVYAVLTHQPLTAELFSLPLLFTCIGLAMADIGLPLIYLLGTEKGRYAMASLIWGIALIPVLLVKLFGIDVYQFFEDAFVAMSGSVLAALAAGTAVLTVLSVLFSAAVYERKEFS